MRNDELDDYISRVKARLVNSHGESYFLEESRLIQLREASEERTGRQNRVSVALRKDRRQPTLVGAEQASAYD